MKKTALENKTDRLWGKYNNNEAEDFWAKYNKLIYKAKKKKAAVHVTAQKQPPSFLKANTVKKSFYARFYLHGKKHQAAILAEISGYALYWWLAQPAFLVIIFFAVNLGKYIHQKKFLNFKITPQGLLIHNKVSRIKTGLRWDDMASAELIREGRKYYLKVTSYQSKEYKYLYALDKKNHTLFFSQLSEKTIVTQKADYNPLLSLF
ncbi:hypothetical protein [uncultured Microscilla sp.]|uniref:hypothetical protein n=1 Tax=uncultured Microscilla sp. TaxID=432653 RepID=UPI00261440DF|nr:hypothetical protein [uncultured Microscilla sp.]